MDSVHFLNVEYILLRLWDFLYGFLTGVFSFFTGTPQSVVQEEGFSSPQAASSFVDALSFTGTQLALLGIALAVIFLAAAIYIRIKLELYEHEEFHKRDAKYHTHDAHHDTHGHDEAAGTAHAEAPKNERWEEVQRLGSSTHESDWRRAIMEADIMLGQALEAQGYRGSTVGERLKDANPLQMTTLDIAWQAHKVRNEIAHAGEGYHLSEWEAKGTLDFYRRVFEELGFI